MKKNRGILLLLYVQTAAVVIALLSIFVLKLFGEQSVYEEFRTLYEKYFEPDTSVEEFFSTDKSESEIKIN